MRALTLIAFFALQLSVFTCGFDIHVHAMNADTGHVVEQQYAEVDTQNKNDADHGCHVHASHTCVELDTGDSENFSFNSVAQTHTLAEQNLKRLPFSIEYPPKA